jgi:hypothetical protein
MANVIPEHMRRIVQSRARARFVLVSAIVVLICAGLSFVALLPSYLTLATGAAGGSPASASKLSFDVKRNTALMTNATALLSVLAPVVAASSTATEAIAEALGERPPGVKVDQITYSAGKPSSLMLVGSAANNSDIGAYKTALAGDPLFSSVSIPVSALVGTDGGRFSITLSGAF